MNNVRSARIAGVILVGIALGVLVIGLVWYFENREDDTALLPIEEAMYVTDWEITKIYGPGTLQQAKIVEQFNSARDEEITFENPVLYRMPGEGSSSSDGIMLFGFDPNRPEMARHLKSK